MKRQITPKEPTFTELEALWHKRQADFVADVWLRMMREPIRCFCYVKPSVGSTWGELLVVRESDTAPEGYELAATEHVPATDKQGIHRWLSRFAGRLPVFPVYTTPETRTS